MPAPETRAAPPERFVARLARGIGYIVTGRPQDWFGPLDPTPPQAPPEVAGRQFDYPSGFNLTAVLDDHSKRATAAPRADGASQ